MKKMIVLASLAVASHAYAGTPVKSEFFYQTTPEKHQVTPVFDYTSTKTKETAGTANKTDQTLSVKYEYGINEMLSTGAQIGWLTGKDESAGGGSSTDEKGLTDVTFFLRGQNSFQEGSSLHYGANLDMSLAKREEDTAKAENNAMSGGIMVKPYVGYQWLVGKGVVGANLSTELDIGERSVETKPANVTSKVKGANESALTAFYELPFEKGLVGASLSYTAVNTLESKTNGTTSERTGGNFWKLKVYPTYEVTETATVIGEVGYSSFLGDSITSNGTKTDVDSLNALNVNVGGRFTF